MTARSGRGITNQQIIETAFDVWGKNGFHDTNLLELSTKLGISKTALYRHFESKNDLLRSMESWFLERFIDMNRRIAEPAGVEAGNGYVTRFVSAYFDFFGNHPGFYVYFIRMIMHRSIVGIPEIREIRGRTERALANEFPQLHGSRSPDMDPYGMYLLITVLYWFFLLIVPKDKGWLRLIVGKPEKPEQHLARITALCLHGICSKSVLSDDDYERIERLVRVEKSELPPENRIKRAVVDTIIKEGLKEATIDKIAASLGMTKSSLYFYFHNKDEMLSGVIESAQKHMLALFHKKLSAFSSFPEQSYAYMAFMASFMRMDQSIILIFNWLRIQNVQLKFPPFDARYIADLFAFVDAAAGRAELECGSLKPPAVGSFLHVLTFQSVIAVEQQQVRPEDLFPRLRNLHGLFMHGLSGEKPVEHVNKKEKHQS